MPSFDYKGISGEKNTYAEGVIEAVNEDEAAYRLRQQKIIITLIKPAKGQKKVKAKKNDPNAPSFLDRFSKVKPKDVVMFTKKTINHG
jgi:type IV pilus assembly protein PilC